MQQLEKAATWAGRLETEFERREHKRDGTEYEIIRYITSTE